jgi:hypothetical protein
MPPKQRRIQAKSSFDFYILTARLDEFDELARLLLQVSPRKSQHRLHDRFL